MSARDVKRSPFAVLTDDLDGGRAIRAIEALTAAGFSIVHKDEIHAPSVERAIAVARDWAATARSVGQPECESMADDIAAALRELMKEVGR